MASKWLRGMSVALVLGGLGACDDGSARNTQCKRICEKNELCDSKTDEMDCVAGCKEQDYLSDTYVKLWAECVVPNSVSCDFAMDLEEVDDCVTDGLRPGWRWIRDGARNASVHDQMPNRDRGGEA